MKIIEKRNLWFSICISTLLIAVGAMLWNSFSRGSIMNFGIDFTGGTLLNLRFHQPVSTTQIREVLKEFDLEESVIQKSEKEDIFIRCQPISPETRIKIMEAFQKKFGVVDLLEADTIGPIIGKELSTQALWALAIASFGIIVYVSFRFEFKYALAALLALFHDAIFVAGMMALLWRDIEIPFVAGILTIMGYSINDTIIVFDRIRENIKKHGKKHFAEIINRSINETFPRTINTVLTTMIMVLALLFFGGKTLKDFALVLLIGFSIGTYSSVFIASPLVYLWEQKEKK